MERIVIFDDKEVVYSNTFLSDTALRDTIQLLQLRLGSVSEIQGVHHDGSEYVFASFQGHSIYIGAYDLVGKNKLYILRNTLILGVLFSMGVSVILGMFIASEVLQPLRKITRFIHTAPMHNFD